LSLLVRVKARDEEAWKRFVHLYSPLVYRWCQRKGLQDADAADVVQEVFKTVAGSIDGFHRDREGDSLRAWLRTITHTRVLDHFRRNGHTAAPVGGSEAQARLQELPDDHEDPGETEEDKHILLRRAVDMVLDGCKEETRQAFLRVVVAGQRPADVARDLGITPNAVYLAKSHVLRRIREEFAQLIDI
jgi:RNA polymerase sigma-70 factor (ECF subfamily)